MWKYFVVGFLSFFFFFLFFWLWIFQPQLYHHISFNQVYSVTKEKKEFQDGLILIFGQRSLVLFYRFLHLSERCVFPLRVETSVCPPWHVQPAQTICSAMQKSLSSWTTAVGLVSSSKNEGGVGVSDYVTGLKPHLHPVVSHLFGKEKFRCYRHRTGVLVFFYIYKCISSLTLEMANSFPRSHSNLVIFFVCMVSLLGFPLWSQRSWEDLHFLSLYYALILVCVRAHPPQQTRLTWTH